MQKNPKTIWILFFIALLLRLIPAAWFSSPPTDDASNYHQIALNLAHGEGFSLNGKPTAFREPLLPLLASFLYRTFGEDYRYVYAFQALLGALTVLLIYRLGMQLFRTAKAAWAGAILTAIYPNFILYSQIFLTETLTAFLFTLTVWMLLKACQSQKNKYYVLSGIFLGLLVLTKAAYLFFIPFLALYFLSFYWKRWNTALTKGLVLLFLISLVLIGGWTLRNYYSLGKFIPVVSRGGTALFYGVYIPYNNLYVYDDQYDDVEKQIIGNETDPVKLDERYYEAAKQYVLEHPVGSALFYLKKMLILWYGPADAIGYPLRWFTGSTQTIYQKPILDVIFRTDARATAIILLYVGAYWALILLALYALWDQKNNKNAWLLAWPVIYATLFYPIVLVSARYKEPLLPLVFVLTGYGWTKRREILEKVRRCLRSKKGD